MDRLNQLKAFMQFYQDNKLGPQGRDFTGQSPYNIPMMAANWANEQMTMDNRERPRMAPNFFGEQTPYAQPQYVQPQVRNAENPYFKRAFALNNDPMSWQQSGNALSAILGR